MADSQHKRPFSFFRLSPQLTNMSVFFLFSCLLLSTNIALCRKYKWLCAPSHPGGPYILRCMNSRYLKKITPRETVAFPQSIQPWCSRQ